MDKICVKRTLFLLQDTHISATHLVELAWRIGSVRDCHAMARDSIPKGNGVKTELHVLRKEQKMGCRFAVDGT